VDIIAHDENSMTNLFFSEVHRHGKIADVDGNRSTRGAGQKMTASLPELPCTPNPALQPTGTAIRRSKGQRLSRGPGGWDGRSDIASLPTKI
jgi:hypothetical protein